jgi:hypothetical protein
VREEGVQDRPGQACRQIDTELERCLVASYTKMAGQCTIKRTKIKTPRTHKQRKTDAQHKQDQDTGATTHTQAKQDRRTAQARYTQTKYLVAVIHTAVLSILKVITCRAILALVREVSRNRLVPLALGHHKGRWIWPEPLLLNLFCQTIGGRKHSTDEKNKIRTSKKTIPKTQEDRATDDQSPFCWVKHRQGTEQNRTRQGNGKCKARQGARQSNARKTRLDKKRRCQTRQGKARLAKPRLDKARQE